MSAVLKSRRNRALIVLAMVAAVGAALSGVEACARQEEGFMQASPAINAQTMAEAVLGGTVEDVVASCGATLLSDSAAEPMTAAAPAGCAADAEAADEWGQAAKGRQRDVGAGRQAGVWGLFAGQGSFAGDVPPWLLEVQAGLETPDQILVGQDGALVSLCWHRDIGQGPRLAALLEMAGWQRVDSGLDGCCSYTRERGEGEWLMVTEWKNANATVVLVRCV